MRTLDIGLMIVVYNFVIGVLLMLASERIASLAKRLGARAQRYARVSVFTFGSCIAALSASVYLAFHLMKLGVN